MQIYLFNTPVKRLNELYLQHIYLEKRHRQNIHVSSFKSIHNSFDVFINN